MLLNNKVCIVTGATRGIGYTTALLFAEHGAVVFVNGRNEQKVNEVVTFIHSQGGKAEPFICDVSDPESVKLAFREFLKKSKKLDVLVNNAGILDDALIGMVSKKQIFDTFSINSFSIIFMCQYASRIMSKNNSGSIINLSSIIGTNGNAGQSVYGGSKAAVIGITKSLAKELAEKNIRVNAIAPGFIDSDMSRSISDKMFQDRVNSVAMGRIGQQEEVGSLAVFLGSDMSSYVTGQIIGVDGGMLI
ncbi:3-oxoacyl-[acyl-carrier protein] reductase [Aequoribacter fuscus]|uniref:3-oxoacyl-[acyl-carrier protein] reductase n=1 Tax=Aequoribacter fuscus TaxID=2518989 RepID=F3L3Q1_9GAMM|nr:SDR family NAD(P)-dependent oxidoreductase [Aequoribacter fuscus]EGG29024.1 3-oxoacyl-[acyl-carrier protein] reductase [Aequoribacter fuscus]QHJ88877.1 SDR family oxidoreductase [Aequoribacter fuscus]